MSSDYDNYSDFEPADESNEGETISTDTNVSIASNAKQPVHVPIKSAQKLPLPTSIDASISVHSVYKSGSNDDEADAADAEVTKIPWSRVDNGMLDEIDVAKIPWKNASKRASVEVKVQSLYTSAPVASHSQGPRSINVQENQVTFLDLDTKHMCKQCQHRPVQCPYCQESIYAHDMSYHIHSVCDDYVIACPRSCDSSVAFRRRHLRQHLDTECSLRTISCPFACFGCKTEKHESPLKASDIPEHMVTYAAKHVDSLARQFAMSDARLDENDMRVYNLEQLVKTKHLQSKAVEDSIRTNAQHQEERMVTQWHTIKEAVSDLEAQRKMVVQQLKQQESATQQQFSSMEQRFLGTMTVMEQVIQKQGHAIAKLQAQVKTQNDAFGGRFPSYMLSEGHIPIVPLASDKAFTSKYINHHVGDWLAPVHSAGLDSDATGRWSCCDSRTEGSRGCVTRVIEADKIEQSYKDLQYSPPRIDGNKENGTSNNKTKYTTNDTTRPAGSIWSQPLNPRSLPPY